MTRLAVIRLAAALWLCAGASSARAHDDHEYYYDLCTNVTIEGRVKRVQWTDPHIWIELQLPDATTSYAEWSSLQDLMNDGVAGPAKAALGLGERIVVTGHPVRDAALIRDNYPAFQNDPDPNIVDPVQIYRTDNSWSWARRSSEPGPACVP